MVWSKTNSTGTRESEQDNTAANGSCFSLVPRLKIARSCSNDVRHPATKRLLPSSNSFSAISGVSVDCARAELGPQNPSPRQSPIRRSPLPHRHLEELSPRGVFVRQTGLRATGGRRFRIL